MNISLDYDMTYTRDPIFWDGFIAGAKRRGHSVFCVTMRRDVPHEADKVREALQDRVEAIFFTGRKAKSKFMFDLGICIHVWVDDDPGFILKDAAG